MTSKSRRTMIGRGAEERRFSFENMVGKQT
jgi:hypothetical protein